MLCKFCNGKAKKNGSTLTKKYGFTQYYRCLSCGKRFSDRSGKPTESQADYDARYKAKNTELRRLQNALAVKKYRAKKKIVDT